MKKAFKSSIVGSNNDGFIATLPSDERSLGWSILHDIQDHVVKIDRNCGPTQLQVWPNPGYSKQEALAILIVAVYASGRSLEDLMSVPEIASHMDVINKRILNLGTINDADATLVEYYLGKLIVDRAGNRVSSRLSNVHYGFRLAWFDDLKDKVVNAKRALEFTSALSLTITPWEKKRRVNECLSVIAIIQDRKNKAETRNNTISNVVAAAKQQVAKFQESLELTPLLVGDKFVQTLDFLDRAITSSKAEFNSLETDDLIELVQQAESLAPISK